jgi:putative ABC transport system permease protein
MRWTAEVRERLRAVFFRAREEAEMDEEMRFHLDMEADRLVREQGLDPAEARRRAAVAFGSVEKHREEVREARGLAWLFGMSLDFKLGARMLVKYPGLTLVGGIAIAFAIGVGAAAFKVVSAVASPSIPLDEGSRIVGLRNWDARRSRVEERALHDFAAWRDELRTVEELGAFQTVERNLITAAGEAEPVLVAEMSAAGFRVARVPPLLGRALVDADERPGAPPVMVIGHDEWRRRFGGDPGIVGRALRLGETAYTVVGVMPDGFAFPVSHTIWVPLRLDPLAHERGRGPEIRVFGRLAPGVSLREARAELATLGRRAAADFPDTHRHLRPEVLPYAESIFPLRLDGSFRAAMWSVNLFFVLFLVLICTNVAMLMFARTATRESEIVVRTALGASRGRIVMQLFAEALVLGGLGALIGLAAAAFGLRWGLSVMEGTMDVMEGGSLPFWVDASLSPATVLYAALLTVLGAVVAGVMPALKVTRGLGSRLRQAAVGTPGARFGGVWTAAIVAQVALTVALPAAAFFTRRDAVQIRSREVPFAAGEYLSARVEMDRAALLAASDSGRSALRARFAASRRELERRLAAEPAVAGAAYASLLPRMDHPQRRIELDEGGAGRPGPSPGHCEGPMTPQQWDCVSSASVDAGYFGVLEAPVLAGRGFHAGDLEPGSRVVVVNRSFVERALGGRNPVGRRLRYLDPEDPDEAGPDREPGPWHEIVGVVRDLGMSDGSDPGESGAGVYHPMDAGAASSVYLAARVRGDPAAFAPRLRAVAAAVDPTLRLHDPVPLDQVASGSLKVIAFWFRIVALASLVALLLSLAGIYSVMSFTVARRTREIGVRVALGADPRRIVAAIFARPLRQVALGVAAGSALVGLLVFAMYSGAPSPGQVAMVAAYAALMMGVCLLACIVPTRRALRVEPTEALRAEA